MRLEHLLPGQHDPSQRALYDKLTTGERSRVPGLRSDVQMVDAEGRLQGPFNAMLHHPQIGDALQELSRRLRFEGVLSARAREIVILVVGESQRSDFEWAAHSAIASSLGITDDEIAALAESRSVDFGDAGENAALDLARALVTTGDADDETYNRAQAALGDDGVFEVSTMVGVYQLLAQQMRLFRVASPRGPW